MNHPLSAVHILIFDHAKPATLLQYPEVLQPDHELWLLIQRNIKEARVGFLNQFVQVGGIDSLRATVHTYQITCISLLNQLSDYQTLTKQSAPAKAEGKALCERFADVQRLLMKELRYLQTHYSLFFDGTQPVPAYVWQKKQEEWNALLPLLQEKWVAAGAEPELLQLFFTPLQKRITETLYPCYEEMQYLATLLEETGCVDTCTNPSATQQLICILCRNNYNHPLFIQFLFLQLRAGLSEDSSLAEQTDYWAMHLKQAQVTYCYDTRWLPQLPPVKKAMSEMISQELTYCERKMKNNLSVAKTGHSTATETTPPVVTNLSVGQLAVLMRLLTDCGVIECGNQSELLKRVAAAVVTTRQNKISAESLRVKYYAPDKAAVTITQEYIAKMMAMLRKY